MRRPFVVAVVALMEITVTCGQGGEEGLQDVTDAAGLKAALERGEPFLIRLPQAAQG